MKRRSKISVLKIDKDLIVSRSLLKEWNRLCIIPLCGVFGAAVLSTDVCPSQRKGYHVYIQLTPPIRAELAWWLQLYLGDDAKRCSLNRAHMKAGFDEWNKLFEGIRPRLTRIYIRRNPAVRLNTRYIHPDRIRRNPSLRHLSAL
jgi:hypothetical protein